MQMKKHLLLILLSVLVLSLVACQSKNDHVKNEKTNASDSTVKEEKSSPNKANETTKNEETATTDQLPTSYTALANRKPGALKDFQALIWEEDKIVDKFGDMQLKATATQDELDQYYLKLLDRLQKDFQGPEKAIRNLRFQALGNPSIKDPRYQFKDHMNVEIVLDASGSMAQKINGTAKMDLAKQAIQNFVNQLPKEANIGIRVYGNKGSNDDKDKEVSCRASDIIYPLSSYDQSTFNQSLNKAKPTGWTPIGLALTEAQKDLSKFDSKTNTNIVYLVSDGVSTCEDDPIGAAKKLYNSNLTPIINVIGFDVDPDGQVELKKIADETQGIYENVSDGNQLAEQLNTVSEIAKEWDDWKAQNKQSIENKKLHNGLDIFTYIVNEKQKEVDEAANIRTVLTVLKEKNQLTDDQFTKLTEKNQEYHKWIESEVNKFSGELDKLNNQNYSDAIKQLEATYENRAQ